MAQKKDYGLPDETLQLIGASPDLFAGGQYLQQGGNASTNLPGSALIAALRSEGTNNPGFSLYANRGNGMSASSRTALRGLFAPAKLSMGRVTRDVTPSSAQPNTRMPRVVVDPVVPDVPSVAPPADLVVTPTDPVTPARRTGIQSVTPDPVTEPDTVPSIYTKPIVSDIPDQINPDTIPLIIPEFPLELPDIPEVPDKTGIVEMYPGDTVIPEVVGPRKGGGGDLPPEFDKYLIDELSPLLSGGGGKGLDLFDMTDFFGGYFGGSDGGGGCPAPWISILLADGSTVKAGDMKPGMEVYTRHEKTDAWGVYPVTAVEMGNDDRWEVVLEDGRTFVGTFNHRVCTDSDWTEIRNLQPGNKLVQQEGFGVVKSSKYLDNGPIVKITVADAHTYISEGFLSHNIKINDGSDQYMAL